MKLSILIVNYGGKHEKINFRNHFMLKYFIWSKSSNWWEWSICTRICTVSYQSWVPRTFRQRHKLECCFPKIWSGYQRTSIFRSLKRIPTSWTSWWTNCISRWFTWWFQSWSTNFITLDKTIDRTRSKLIYMTLYCWTCNNKMALLHDKSRLESKR